MNQSPITFAPRSNLLDHFRDGWRLYPGHPYRSDDWAILLYKPETATAVPDSIMERWAARFARRAPRPVMSNGKSARSSTRNGAKLNWPQVLEIRQLYSEGRSRANIADAYRVSPSAISAITSGRSWQVHA